MSEKDMDGLFDLKGEQCRGTVVMVGLHKALRLHEAVSCFCPLRQSRNDEPECREPQ